FFFEYLPPFSRVRITYDLEGFHYPLAAYAARALRDGRVPLWDPGIYCGLTFVGNPQAALFYPPQWFAWLHFSFTALEVLMVAHVCAALLLCFFWLRRRGLAPVACWLGSGVFAFSGYMMLQLQHLGYVGAYTWI